MNPYGGELLYETHLCYVATDAARQVDCIALGGRGEASAAAAGHSMRQKDRQGRWRHDVNGPPRRNFLSRIRYG